MASLTLTYRSPGFEVLIARLSILKDALNRDDVKRKAALVAKREVKNNFSRQRNADGTPWPKLRYRDGVPFHGERGSMARGITEVITRTGFTVAAGDETEEWNAVHNYGSKKWRSGVTHKKGPFKGLRKGIPQRQFMYLSVKAVDNIVRKVREYVRKKVRGR